MKQEKSCGAIIANPTDSNQILLIQHKNGKHWAFPKGHMEPGETEEQTALREIREETGLSVSLDTDFRTIVTYSPKEQVMKDVVYFAAVAQSTNTAPQPEEVLQIQWCPLEAAIKQITFEGDRHVLEEYISYTMQKK